MPRHTISDKTYDTIFLSIDEKAKMVTAVVAFGAQNGVKTFLADVAAENLGSCAVMRVLGFTPTENGTFHRGSTTLEYRNLTFRKEL